MSRVPLSGAVLVGGESRRMGTDKALLSLRAGDPPLARLVIERVRQFVDEVFLVGGDRPGYAELGIPVVLDRVANAGPLGGIATALEAATHDHCLVVGCDMPFLSQRLLDWMVEQPRDYDVLIPRLAGMSRQAGGLVFHTLHAIYGKRCLPAIRQQLAAGDRQVIGFYDAVRVQVIEAERVRELDATGRSFFNVNTPEAAREAACLLDELGGPGCGV